MSIYDEMRAILALGLKPNEMKVWMTYRLEMDEAARQVRGKSQAQLREVAGISESQFSAASGSLQKLGLISVQRFANAAQLISVTVPNSEGSEIGNPREQEFGTPEIQNSEPPKSEGSSLYTAPVSTPKSAPGRASANDDELPSHVKPIANWSTAFATPDANHGVEFSNGRLILVNGTRAEWLAQFDGDAKALELALIETAGEIQPNSRSHSLKAQVLRSLARKVRDRLDRDRRYAAAASAKSAPKPPPPGTRLTVNRHGEIIRVRADA